MIIDTIALFITCAGYVVGLGAVTVIDTHGFFARHSSYWTQTTIRAHKITKPLIWIGITLVTIGITIIYYPVLGSLIPLVHISSIAILILNGFFLSFIISPRLIKREKEGRDTELLPSSLQKYITISFVISLCGWWGSLLLFSYYVVVSM